MAVNASAYSDISNELRQKSVTLVAVSKTKPVEEIRALYQLGQRDFGENYVQELIAKQSQLPTDIRWHFIGHLQSNKVKQVASFVHLIHGVDSLKLLMEINKQASKSNRIIDCLLQIHIAEEETKFGLNEQELDELLNHAATIELSHVRILGLMGMASFTENQGQVRSEFRRLKDIFSKHSQFTILSMGMSGDYQIAIAEGSNMVRIGSLLFGARN